MPGRESAERDPATGPAGDPAPHSGVVGVRGLEIAVPAGASRGDAPTWDAATSTLLWVDGPRAEVHRYRPDDGTDEAITLPQWVGAAKPRTKGGLVLNLRDGIGLRDLADRLVWLVYWQRDGVRAGDAGVDPSGRLWAATTHDDHTPDGWLVRVRGDGRATVVSRDLAISNGVAWSPEGDRMYHIDSPTRRIDIFDYDDPSGEVSGRRPLCAVADTDGVPDGLCVDADGCVWVAVNGGGQVRRYTPSGRLDRVVEVPVSTPSGCCFGGEDFTDLYVTTVSVEDQPLSGAVFVAPGIGSGLPSPRFTG